MNKEVTEYNIADGDEVSLGEVPGTDYNTETEYIYDDSSNGSSEAYSETEYAAVEWPALIRVNGYLYYDSAETSTELRCGMMDGTIDSVCEGDIPAQNNQSNFGSGYNYQYGVDT